MFLPPKSRHRYSKEKFWPEIIMKYINVAPEQTKCDSYYFCHVLTSVIVSKPFPSKNKKKISRNDQLVCDLLFK